MALRLFRRIEKQKNMLMRRKTQYFERSGDVKPISVTVEKRISFSEVDGIAIVWHGHYPKFFEMAWEKLSRKIGLSYRAYFENKLKCPIVQLHTDYYAPLELEEKISVKASLIWTEAARLNTEYAIYKENGRLASTGFTVQIFTDLNNNEPYFLDPPLFKKIKAKWVAGKFE